MIFRMKLSWMNKIYQRRILLLCIGFPIAYSSLAYSQLVNSIASDDLDSDGVPDLLDSDQDNDGIPDALEGVSRLANLSDSIAPSFDVNSDTESLNQGAGSSFQYRLIRTESETGLEQQFDLSGHVLSTDTRVDWTTSDTLLKIRNRSSGSTTIDWRFQRDGLDVELDIDLTISDLDGIRAETVVVPAVAVVGYSLSLNSNISVDTTDNLLSFSGLGADEDSLTNAVTLHLRNSAGIVVTYKSELSGLSDLSEQSIADTAIAGFRHGFQTGQLNRFFPVSQFRDSDADGIFDHRDLDSDNDGLSDVDEAGGIDENRDGLVDGDVDSSGVPLQSDRDLDQSSVQAAYQATEVISGGDPDGDGILSTVDGSPDSFGSSAVNGTAVDSDNDGLTDRAEIQVHLTDPLNSDTDSDGINDAEELLVHGTSPTSLDTDQDGFSDGVEIQHGTNPLSAEVFPLQQEVIALDSDSDGIPDTIESVQDYDNDGVADKYDLDSDNDGLTDIVETGGADLNADGKVDDDSLPKVTQPSDFDGDSLPDYLDLDSDQDGFFDLVESGGVDVDNNGVVDQFQDVDADGWDDRRRGSVLHGLDADLTGVFDHLEFDDSPGVDDSDGVDVVLDDLLANDESEQIDPNAIPLRTGIEGGAGCSVTNSGTARDPLLPILLLSAFIGLRQRRRCE